MNRQNPPPFVLKQHGMADLSRRRRREGLAENLEIARQCREAAAEVAEQYPIASRLLMEEAARWAS